LSDEKRQEEERVARELIARYRDVVYRQARALAGRAGIADEIFQDAFVRAFRWVRKNPSVDLDRLEGFVRHCTKLAAIDLHRKQRRYPLLSENAERLAVVSPEGKIAARIDIQNAISQLPEKERAVTELTLEGFGEQEIAHVLGLSANYVYVLTYRAKAIMRRFLSGEKPAGADE
jgi:RNA polymerase sigma factor (sigma-70 family)